ncbi:MAG: glycosyltransferase family 39 protein [Gemmatimonadaceae bacterium]|nr:glycosyltransferase family 39 protein [Gemmatimonadaceae bacterium]
MMLGELPHRDFGELYTGGLAFLNAAAFRLLGANLWTLRLVLFASFLAWLPALFYVASRFARPLVAGAVVCLSVAWSLPVYPGAMASWYNLFLATIGAAFVLRFIEGGRPRWLFAAGVAGGLSFLVKVIGLYYIAAVLLFIVFHAQERARANARRDAAGGRGYTIFVSLSMLLFCVALFMVVRSHLHPMELIQFVAPGVLIALLLARGEWAYAEGESRQRFTMLARLLGPFALGAAIPVALFLLRYLSAGALQAWAHGVFVVPQRRLASIAVHALPPWTLLSLVPFVLLYALGRRTARQWLGRRETVAIVIALLLLLRATGGNGWLYRNVWFAARSLIPLLVITGVILLLRSRADDADDPLRRERTMLLLAVTAMCSLVQFPYTISVYFCYVAPLVPLLALALHRFDTMPSRTVPVLLLAFFAAFPVLRMHGTRIASIGESYQRSPPLAPLTMTRGGIMVSKRDAELYGTLVSELEAKARNGYTWASPDSPEVYFLSGLANPTRTLFEVFDDSASQPDQVLQMLDARAVTAVVLSTPSFSPPISAELYALLSRRYPHAEYVGPFQLRWRD